MPAYLTAAELMERWKCSRSHVTREARIGRLVGMRLGSDWRFSLAAVEAYEAEHTSEPVAAANVAPKPEPPRREAVLPDGPYLPVFKGPVPWRSDVIEAAPAAGRGRSSGKKKAASQRH